MSLQDILQQAEQLPTHDKWRLVRLLLDDLEETESGLLKSSWQTRLQATYGILADDPIDIPPDLPFTEREPLD